MRNHRLQHSSHRQAVLAERAREMRQSLTASEQVLWLSDELMMRGLPEALALIAQQLAALR